MFVRATAPGCCVSSPRKWRNQKRTVYVLQYRTNLFVAGIFQAIDIVILHEVAAGYPSLIAVVLDMAWLEALAWATNNYSVKRNLTRM